MKQLVTDLALFGGQPEFNNKLHVGRPNIGDHTKLLKRIENALNRRWLTNNGPFVQQFESRIAELTGAKHVIVMGKGLLRFSAILIPKPIISIQRKLSR